ncbi:MULTISPECIES: DUF2911 domain-containing protein [Spirosoma]|uniref:DUF2911 domain-containing protein n=1 Tax=Spirosoma sordidisoli TaxID=2502893 RepID=A0A4V1RWZ9_9BACT|nr:MULTISPECIES: DUF2911 domain-containing protein [Spirosoma]RYC72028.1 DUF2911 domain-containing protein [Spirosoma sordidisoli]
MFARLLSMAAVACLTGTAYAQIQLPAASPSATVSQQVGLGTVTVEYARPSLKGRTMFGDQVPYGKVWRTGANKITNIVLSEDMLVAGKAIPAGRYGLYAIPTAADFTFIVNKDANSWGAYDYKEANDVARFAVKTEKTNAPAEALTFEFTDFTPTSANLTLRWEKLVARLPLKNDPDTKIMAQIAEQTAKADVKPGVLSAAANYYYDTNRDMKQALTWANKVVESEKQYWTYHLRAKIAAKTGDCKQARADAQQSLELAKKAGDDAYIKNNERILADCK